MYHNRKTIDAMVRGYLDAALWASSDDFQEPMDRRYSVDAFTKATRANVEKACKRFVELALADLKLLEKNPNGARFDDPEYIGHDLYFTTVGAGVGFWDRGLGDLGERLSDHARSSHWVEGAMECGNNRHIELWIEFPQGASK